jgi:ferredoxin
MKVKIESEKCLGCGVCVNICPDGIKMIDGIAKVADEKTDCFKEASEVCPINIIKIN